MEQNNEGSDQLAFFHYKDRTGKVENMKPADLYWSRDM